MCSPCVNSSSIGAIRPRWAQPYSVPECNALVKLGYLNKERGERERDKISAHPVWADWVRQPRAGEDTLMIAPLHCPHPNNTKRGSLEYNIVVRGCEPITAPRRVSCFVWRATGWLTDWPPLGDWYSSVRLCVRDRADGMRRERASARMWLHSKVCRPLLLFLLCRSQFKCMHPHGVPCISSTSHLRCTHSMSKSLRVIECLPKSPLASINIPTHENIWLAASWSDSHAMAFGQRRQNITAPKLCIYLYIWTFIRLHSRRRRYTYLYYTRQQQSTRGWMNVRRSTIKLKNVSSVFGSFNFVPPRNCVYCDFHAVV